MVLPTGIEGLEAISNGLTPFLNCCSTNRTTSRSVRGRPRRSCSRISVYYTGYVIPRNITQTILRKFLYHILVTQEEYREAILELMRTEKPPITTIEALAERIRWSSDVLRNMLGKNQRTKISRELLHALREEFALPTSWPRIQPAVMEHGEVYFSERKRKTLSALIDALGDPQVTNENLRAQMKEALLGELNLKNKAPT